MSEIIKKIDKDTIEVTETKIIDLRPLRNRVLQLTQELNLILEEPDEITLQNTNKFAKKEEIENEIARINKELESYK